MSEGWFSTPGAPTAPGAPSLAIPSFGVNADAALKLLETQNAALRETVKELAAVARAAEDHIMRMRDCFTREDITIDDEAARDAAEGVVVTALAGLSPAARKAMEVTQ